MKHYGLYSERFGRPQFMFAVSAGDPVEATKKIGGSTEELPHHARLFRGWDAAAFVPGEGFSGFLEKIGENPRMTEYEGPFHIRIAKVIP